MPLWGANPNNSGNNPNYLAKLENLADVPDKAQARTNLNIPDLGDVLLKEDNLSGLSDIFAAQNNLNVLSSDDTLALFESATGLTEEVSDRLDADRPFNVDDEGADNTGAVDAYNAFTTTVTTATNGGTKFGRIKYGYSGSSIYTVVSSSIPIYSNTVHEGNGATILNNYNNASYGCWVPVQTGNSSTVFNKNIYVRDVIFKTDVGANGKQMVLAQMKDCVFENVDFTSDGEVGQFTIGNTNRNLKFINCRFKNYDTYCQRITGTTSLVIFEGCEFDCQGGSCIFASGSTVKNIIVRDCTILNCAGVFADLFSVANFFGEKLTFINSAPWTGSGELVNANSACTNVVIKDYTVENMATPFVNTASISNGAQTQVGGGLNAVGTGASAATGGQIRVGRLVADQGTSLASADVSISAGWGATATKSITGTDMNGLITIGAAGAGQVANPTVTVTYKDGSWPTSPRVQVHNASGGTTGHIARVTSMSSSSFTFTAEFTPVAGTSYTYTYTVHGRK